MNKPNASLTVRDYFDQRAQLWEEERQSYYSDDVRSEVLNSGAFGNGHTVIDYGSGSGYLTHALIDGGVSRIIAVDISHQMLLELQRQHGENIDIRIAEDGLIPVEDKAADGLVTNMVLHHLEEPAKFFKECQRVLKPGGKVVVTDMVSYNAENFTRDQNDRWPGFELSEIDRWMNDANLNNIDIRLIGQRCCATVEAANGGSEIFIASASVATPV